MLRHYERAGDIAIDDFMGTTVVVSVFMVGICFELFNVQQKKVVRKRMGRNTKIDDCLNKSNVASASVLPMSSFSPHI